MEACFTLFRCFYFVVPRVTALAWLQDCKNHCVFCAAKMVMTASFAPKWRKVQMYRHFLCSEAAVSGEALFSCRLFNGPRKGISIMLYPAKESLNKSSAAEQRIFSSACEVSNVGNTPGIPELLQLSDETIFRCPLLPISSEFF